MAIETPAAFLEALERSNLLTDEQLATARETAKKATKAKMIAAWLVQKGWLTRWQAAQLLVGRTSWGPGKYKYEDLLGRGGMGNVYLARHTMMNRSVAIKTIAKELSKDPSALSRFLTEARAVASLDHPNIVHAYNVDNEGDTYYMVLEYVEGRDLQQIVEKKGPLEPTLAVDYVRQAADGLAHAHEKGMIHCDIKPSNLIVNPQGVVKILDMGLARLVGGESAVSPEGNGSGVLVGTIDYMAPEQAAQCPDLDHRADIYSLGCTLYFLLTGHAPFPEGTKTERIVKHQSQEPQSILEERPGTPRDLVRICRKMMAKDPKDRFQSAAELSSALAEWRPQQRVLKAVPLGEGGGLVEGEQEATSDRDQAAVVALPADQPSKAGIGQRLQSAAGRVLALLPPGRPRVIAVSSIAGIAVLVLVVLLVAVVVKSRPPAPKKQETARATNAEGEKKAPAKKASMWDSLQTELEERDKEQAASATAAKDANQVATAKPGEAPKEAAKPEPSKAEPAKPDQPKPEVKPEQKTDPSKPEAPKPEAKAEPPKPEPPKPEPPKPEPPKAEPPKTEPAPPKVEEKPAPKPEPPAPKPTGDPMKDFPKVVNLPDLEEGGDAKPSEPTPLGRIRTAADVPWSLELIGGDLAYKKNRPFTMESKEVDGKPAWIVSLSGSGSKDEEQAATEVAKLWRDKDALMFQWLAGAASAPANYLRNCLLEIRAGGPIHSVPLRAPVQAEPIVINLQGGVMSQVLELGWLPDLSTVRLEVTQLEIKDREVKVPNKKTGKPEEVKKKWPWVLDPKTPVEAKLPVKIVFFYEDRYHKEAPSPVHLDVKLLKKAKDWHLECRMPATVVGLFKAMRPDSVTTLQTQRKGLEDSKSPKPVVERQLDQVDAMLWCADLYQSAHGTGRIYYRIFATIGNGNQQLDLVLSPPPAPAKPGK